MGLARSLTLLWPGLPWLWLRGSRAGLVLALAFAVAVDVAVVTTWVWTELIDIRWVLGLWTAIAALWLAATASAAAAFPRPIPAGRDAATEPLFVRARDAYLARDWITAETQLRTLLDLAPTDGEAQLLLASLFRRVGRNAEAVAALDQLARSDSGKPWHGEIARELDRVRGTDAAPPGTAQSLPFAGDSRLSGGMDRAA